MMLRTLSYVKIFIILFEILALLTKNRKQRISLEHVLEHPWIAKINKKITEMRRKSSDEGNRIKQFLAYTNTDVSKMEAHLNGSGDEKNA